MTKAAAAFAFLLVGLVHCTGGPGDPNGSLGTGTGSAGGTSGNGSVVVVGSSGTVVGTSGSVSSSGTSGRSSTSSTTSTTSSSGTSGTSGGCHAGSDCPGEQCVAPGQVLCGGAQPPPAECTVDADCSDAGVGLVCVAQDCGNARCTPKCAGDQDCISTPTGLLTCNAATGHCVPKSCGPTSCPTNFTCVTPSDGCIRKTCSNDSVCTGACVNGQCWTSTGTCQPPPP